MSALHADLGGAGFSIPIGAVVTAPYGVAMDGCGDHIAAPHLLSV
ncbi:hypothetical protein [Lysobacter sp. Root667]|nr:hypothetical protein [Lysobacter sp. Root667]